MVRIGGSVKVATDERGGIDTDDDVRRLKFIQKLKVLGLSLAEMQELETLYDVVHDEVEGAALDAATALRSLRRGNGMLGRVRRILVPTR